MRKVIPVLITLFLLSCAASRDRENIREGLLTLNLHQSAFLESWGKPDRTRITSGQEIVQAGWNGASGGFFKGKETLEVWEYEEKKTELVFGRRKVLVGWKTGSTVKELSSPRK